MASYQPPLKNSAYTFYVWLVSQADTKIMQASPTLAAGDVKVAVDDAAPANVTDIPVVDADFTKRVKVTLTAAEMNGDNISVQFSDASGAEWCDLAVNLQTAANRIDDLATKVDTAQADLDTLTGTDGATLATSQPNYAPAVAGDEMDLVDAPNATAVTAIQNGVSTFDPAADDVARVTLVDTVTTNTDMRGTDSAALASTLATVATYVDTEVAAIKAVTDELPDGGALTALLASIASILADTGTDGVVLSTATQQAIADTLLARSVANVEDTAGIYSLAAIVLAAFESAIAGTTWTINKTDGVTAFATRTVTVDDTADPITGVT